MAISDFNRQRKLEFTSPIMASVKKGDIDRVYKSWQNAVYPETRMDSIRYLKQSAEAFKKYEKMNLQIVSM